MILGSLQENLLTILAFDQERAPIVRAVIAPELFGGPYRLIAARIYDYLDNFKKPPGDHLPDLLSDKLEGRTAEAEYYTEILESLHQAKEHINPEYVMASLETFVKRQSMRSIAIDLQKALQKDTDAGLEEAERLIAGANHLNLKVFDPGTRLSDKRRALEFLDLPDDSFPTGIKELDLLGLGPTRKELWLFIGNAKAGKCIVEGEPVCMSDGSYVAIEKVSGNVPSADLNGRFAHVCSSLTCNGIQEAFVLTTRTGRKIRLTWKHRLLTKMGWRPLADLKIGDKIAAPLRLSCFGKNTEAPELMRVLGYLIADGGLTKDSTPTFTKLDNVVAQDMKRCLKYFDCTLTPSKSRLGHYWVTSGGKENMVVGLLKECGLIGKKSNDKHIPNFVFRADKASVVEFLRALFTCDGSILEKTSSGSFEYSTTSQELARQLDHLLTRFGLVCKTRTRLQQVNNQPYYSWLLVISGKTQFAKLVAQIGLLFSKGDKAAALVKKFGASSHRSSYICNDVHGSLFFDKITSIAPLGKRRVYDLAVIGTHNFVAGNILVHNSWALGQLAKSALHHRYRVVHISLEMSEKRTTQRYFQSLFAMAKRRDAFDVTRFQRDSLGRINGFNTVKSKPALSMDDPKIRKKLEYRIDRWSSRILDNILVKEFPTGQMSVLQLRAYLDNLEASEKFVPDLLVVDYPDLMKLDKDNYRLALDEAFKELRGLAVERNIALACVSQANRLGVKSKQVGVENVSEAYSKIAHSDVVITYTQTPGEHKLGLARLHVAAGRNDRDRFTVYISQAYNTGQFVVDSTMGRGTYWQNLPTVEEGP